MQIKKKIRESIDADGKKIYTEETYVLSRKIMRQRTRKRLEAEGERKINKHPYNVFTHEKDSSPLKLHWREYGAQV